MIFRGELFAEAPFNKKLTNIDEEAPEPEIEHVFYINMDESVKRKQQFLDNYNAPWPLTRIPGVRKTGKNAGTIGCTLAHTKALFAVHNDAKNKAIEAWYLICEDDCIGNLKDIVKNKFVKTIIKNVKEKKLINLSRTSSESHSLNSVNCRLTAYLIHSSFALELKHLIAEKLSKNGWIVDKTTSRLLKSPMFFYPKANNRGCYVNLIENSKEPSERIQIDKEN